MTTLIIARHGNTFGKGDTPTRVGARTDGAAAFRSQRTAQLLEIKCSQEIGRIAAVHSAS